MSTIEEKIQAFDDKFNKRYNKLMRKVNIGIALSLLIFFTGIGILIYGYIKCNWQFYENLIRLPDKKG